MADPVKLPMDFGVSMRDEVLEHKRNDDEGLGMYWSFGSGYPRGVRKGSRMWVANRGQWIGYFVIESPGDGTGEPLTSTEDPEEDGNSVIFRSRSFVRKYGGERRPFMGYTLKVPGR
jgi:hypothetical protein